MKKTYSQRLLVLALAWIALVAVSCHKGESTRIYHIKKSYLMKAEDLRALQVSPVAPREIREAGKIYVYKDYLFVNEPNEGIHVIDNAVPANPKRIAFIPIAGNQDMAVNNNILYADNYIDLLALDISDPKHITLAKRVKDVFMAPYSNYGGGKFLAYKDTVIKEKYTEGRYDDKVFNSFSQNSTGGGYGQGGSMARFTLLNGHLYTVSNSDLRLFNVNSPADPQFVTNIYMGWGIETIFPYENKLFIGSNTGMHIYDASNASAPVRLSTFSHVKSCDPVVVNGKYAYVTLRSGNMCAQGQNQLLVLDVEDASKPVLLNTYSMKNPHGLAVVDNTLFLCEGGFGLKTFNIQNGTSINSNPLQHVFEINAVDVIPTAKSLIVTGSDGVYQFNYSNPAKLLLLSKLEVKAETY